ncbi:MAG: hypothetical protein DMG05_15515 [Acidobacteria bacterium]|nr:MAG: hypothetical protein DMG05_15515 [Acidobacteriota bacterium]
MGGSGLGCLAKAFGGWLERPRLLTKQQVVQPSKVGAVLFEQGLSKGPILFWNEAKLLLGLSCFLDFHFEHGQSLLPVLLLGQALVQAELSPLLGLDLL